MKGTIQERFEEKYEKSDGCWNWTAHKNSDGYGTFRISDRHQYAHRIAYQLYVGEIPAGLCVCHRCDNPSCVRPEHLFLGTFADNAHDCMSKGRWKDQSGEKHWRTKLTTEQVRTIRTKHSEGARGVDLAREFGLVRSAVSKIVNQHTWVKV